MGIYYRAGDRDVAAARRQGNDAGSAAMTREVKMIHFPFPDVNGLQKMEDVMKSKKMFCVACALSIAATAASAGGNSDNAKAMAENIKTYGGNLATAVKANGPFDQGPGERGWGNAGSLLTGNGTVDSLDGTIDNDFAAGDQVSKSGKRK